MDERIRFRCRWLVTPHREPLENPYVEVQHGSVTEVTQRPLPGALDLGNVAILPALVNAHTHLEFSHCRTPVRPLNPFTDWIPAVMRARLSEATERQMSIRSGTIESVANGVSWLGEIATGPESTALLAEAGVGGVVFRELIGLSEARRANQFQVAKDHISAAGTRPVQPNADCNLIHGISPHAPYTVHPELLTQLVSLAQRHAVPVAMHLAETQAELQLLQNGSGPFRDLLEQLGVWVPDAFSSRRSVLDILRELSVLESVSIVHGNYLSDDELRFIAQHDGMTLVYCPRTHHAFGHQDHPWRRLREIGGRVALGTDSRASNPSLALWDEVQFLHQLDPGISPRELLSMVTTAGLRAWGRSEQWARIELGSPANLWCAKLSGDATEPWQQLLNQSVQIQAVMRAGQWRSSVDQSPSEDPHLSP